MPLLRPPRFNTEDESRNLAWLAPISFGEAWHNNHHAFPASASHGLRWIEIDPCGWVIRALARTGLAWNVRQVSLAERAAKARAPAVREVSDGVLDTDEAIRLDGRAQRGGLA